MKYLLASAMIILLLASPANSELMGVTLKLVKDGSGWKYTVTEGDVRNFASKDELREYFRRLSNPRDGIWLEIESTDQVSVDELISVLTMVKANPQGITLKKVILDTGRDVSKKEGATTRPAG